MQVFGNPFENWVVAGAIALGSWIVLNVVKRFCVARFGRVVERRHGPWDEAALLTARRTKQLSLFAFSLAIGARALVLTERTELWINRGGLLILLVQLLVWGDTLICHAVEYYVRERTNGDGARTTSVRALGILGRLLLLSTILLWGLDNFGVNITTLVAGLGIGGIAVALAAQNILGDLFASITMVLDKPFVIGDFIVVDQFEGTIEHIGMKTTRVRSVNGEQLIFPNANLLQSRVRNYKRMQERRSVFLFGVMYGTPAAKLEVIPAEVKAIIERQPQIRFERAFFKRLGDSSLDFEVVYWITSADYSVYATTQQRINLDLYRRMEELKIDFAFPSRTIYLQSSDLSAIVKT